MGYQFNKNGCHNQKMVIKLPLKFIARNITAAAKKVLKSYYLYLVFDCCIKLVDNSVGSSHFR